MFKVKLKKLNNIKELILVSLKINYSFNVIVWCLSTKEGAVFDKW
jgi:hypothetical protein